jgi:hypothetical protein
MAACAAEKALEGVVRRRSGSWNAARAREVLRRLKQMRMWM